MSRQESQTFAIIEKARFDTYLEAMNQLMHDGEFLISVAKHCDESYRIKAAKTAHAAGKPIDDWMLKPLLTPEQEEMVRNPKNIDLNAIAKKLRADECTKEERLQLADQVDEYKLRQDTELFFDINKAGFAAVQGALGALADRGYDPMLIIRNAAEQRDISDDVKRLFMRFAHATWYADTHFRNRELRETAKPWDNLVDSVQALDWDQAVSVMHTMFDHMDAKLFAF
jgi:hypothetical protein